MDAARREQILAAARGLGPEKFNRLVSSVDQVRALGRLRYWQEDWIAGLSGIGEPALLGAPLPHLVEIYRKVREGSPHREREFRPTFERVFGERMSAFATPLSREQVIEALLASGYDKAIALELMGEKRSNR